MEAGAIMELFYAHAETAPEELEKKYRGLCTKIASQILGAPEDVEECFNDVLLKVWSSIPPDRPQNMTAYVCKITRNLALDRYRHQHRKKRSADHVAEIVQEFEAGSQGLDVGDQVILTDTIDRFLGDLAPQQRLIFVRRYWFFDSIKDITALTGVKESSVKVILYRLRKKLACILKEGEV